MTKSQPITVRIKKGKDGRTALSCIRADGTTTWQRQEGGQAAFFPRHDLTHYAVETTLGISEGFFGLVASGWDFSDFGHPWPRGPLPAQGNVTEEIVALFDLERASGEQTSAEEINRKVAEYCAEKGLPAQVPITEESVARVRQQRSELFSKWESVQPGGAIELPFDSRSK
jgi:2-polyprenyl-6-methoxyphenol hydroxylase-like FAD-dependent oxidoreductase